MGMALKNLASAMNDTQALEAAAIILGSSPTPEAIAYRAEQLDYYQTQAQKGCCYK
jgi:hypothetical protein